MKQIDEDTAYRLAAISTMSISNTRDSYKSNRIEEDHEAWTVAYEDVATAIKREIDLIERLGQVVDRLQIVEKALRFASGMISTFPEYSKKHPQEIFNFLIKESESDLS